MNTNQNVYSQTQTQTQTYNLNGNVGQPNNQVMVNGAVSKKRNPIVSIALLPFKLLKLILITFPLWIFKTIFGSSIKVIWNFVKLVFAVVIVGAIAWGVVWMGNYFSWW